LDYSRIPFECVRCNRYGHIITDWELKLNKIVWVKNMGTTSLEARSDTNGENHMNTNHSKGGVDSQSTNREDYVALLIPQEVDDTQKNICANS
jgi:hypothetical protein